MRRAIAQFTQPDKCSYGFGGAEGTRTPDPHNAIVVLYQLSYDPDQSAQNLKNGQRLSKGFFPG